MRKVKLFMGTIVEIDVTTSQRNHYVEERINRAFQTFRQVEQTCSRFDHDSELMRLCRQIGIPVQVSPLLFEPLKFALEIARWTDGIFDPMVGKSMEKLGFNRHYVTGQAVQYPVAPEHADYRDIELNEQDHTVLLKKPLIIDLGAVAKGFAIDLAVSELQSFERFIVNAGGDLFAGGAEASVNTWTIGIQHPEQHDQIIHSVDICNQAVCTSGSYIRISPDGSGMHHILHPKTNASPREMVSCSVIAPYAMLADAVSTATFLLGLNKGSSLIEQAELQGILISPDLQIMNIGGN